MSCLKNNIKIYIKIYMKIYIKTTPHTHTNTLLFITDLLIYAATPPPYEPHTDVFNGLF